MSQVHTQSILNVVGSNNSVSSTIFQTLYFEFGDLFEESLVDALDLAIPSSVCDYDLTFNIEDTVVKITQLVFFSSVALSLSVSFDTPPHK
jgi:predicted TPR repeat methyltransferase